MEVCQRGTKQALLTSLITCLLYCSIEAIQGHFHSGMKHIVAGIRLLADNESALLEQEVFGLGVSNGFVDSLRRLFVSLGTQAMGLQESEPDPMVAQYLRSANEEQHAHSFTSTEQTLAEIAHLQNDVTRLLTWADAHLPGSGTLSNDLLLAGQKLQRRFDLWTLCYHRLLLADSRTIRSSNHFERSAYLVLRIHQLMTRIILAQLYIRDSMGWDQSLDDFGAIVDVAEEFLDAEAEERDSSLRGMSSSGSFSLQVTFTMTMGIIPALFLTATRCRDGSVRHAAIRLLKQTHRRESVWDSQVVAEVAERAVMLEEASAVNRNGWQERPDKLLMSTRFETEGPPGPNYPLERDLPREVRVHTFLVDFLGLEENRVQVSMLRMESSVQHEQLIAWDE